jgi:4-hydroxyphenylpyruvate dioxygenase
MNEHISKHGDGVKDVAFLVEDATKIYDAAVENGAKSISKPNEIKSEEEGSIILASVQTYGDTIHTFIEKKDFKGVFLPGFKSVTKKDFFNTIT